MRIAYYKIRQEFAATNGKALRKRDDLGRLNRNSNHLSRPNYPTEFSSIGHIRTSLSQEWHESLFD